LIRFEDFEDVVGLSLFINTWFDFDSFDDLADIVGLSVGKSVG